MVSPAQPHQLDYATTGAHGTPAASREWFLSVRNGIAILLIMALVLFVIGATRGTQPIDAITQTIVLGICPGSFLLAMWKMTRGDAASSFTKQRAATRWTIRATAIAHVLLLAVAYVVGGFGILQSGLFMWGLPSLLGGIASCFMLDYLARIARRFQWTTLRVAAASAVWVWGLATLLSIPILRYFFVFGFGANVRVSGRVEPLVGLPMQLPQDLRKVWDWALLGLFGIRSYGVPWVTLVFTLGSILVLVLFLRVFHRSAHAAAGNS